MGAAQRTSEPPLPDANRAFLDKNFAAIVRKPAQKRPTGQRMSKICFLTDRLLQIPIRFQLSYGINFWFWQKAITTF